MDTMASSGMLALLVVQQGRLAGRQFRMGSPTVIIGRTADNDLIIDDPEVSRRHARLSWNGRQFIIPVHH